MGEFDFSGLYNALGELTVARAVIGIVAHEVSEHGTQGYAIRSINRIRRRFGLESQAEAAALFRDIRDNVDAARDFGNLSLRDQLPEAAFPLSSNVLGGDDSTDRFVWSGDVQLVDQFGDMVRRVPFVVEGNDNLTQQELINQIGESVQGFVDKYLDELQDDLGGGGLFPANINVTFVAQRETS